MMRDLASEFIELPDANDLAVKTASGDDTLLETNLKALNSMLEPEAARAWSWLKELEDLFNLIRIRERVFAVIVFIILAMAAAGIANTMLMAMLERKREIGILMASGMLKSQILKLFLLEGFFIGLCGSTAGLIIGSLIVLYFQKHGIRIPQEFTKMDGNFPVSDTLYFYFSMSHALLYFATGILTAVLAAFYPSWKATALNPVEAISDRQ